MAKTVSESIKNEKPIDKIKDAIYDLSIKLKWIVINDEENKIEIKVPFNYFSSGEKIEIEFNDESMRITSYCNPNLQFFENGKNQSNINLIKHSIKIIN
jgi:hypothetical protein